MSLPPIYYHVFRNPVKYIDALRLQNKIYSIQLANRRSSSSNKDDSTDTTRLRTHRDYILLLEHRPVYTTGRRQREVEMTAQRLRLLSLGADFECTQRGGELTYHGPGQIVGYPLLDLGRSSSPMSIREYICLLQKTIQEYLLERHGIQHAPSEHTGVFIGEGAKTKLASIGVQVRHRLTMHGFALNVTPEPLPWFEEIVACGLEDVKAGCVAHHSRLSTETKASTKDDVQEEERGRKEENKGVIMVQSEIPHLISRFSRAFQRPLCPLEIDMDLPPPDPSSEPEDPHTEVIRHIRSAEFDAKLLAKRKPPRSKPRQPEREVLSFLPFIARETEKDWGRHRSGRKHKVVGFKDD